MCYTFFYCILPVFNSQLTAFSKNFWLQSLEVYWQYVCQMHTLINIHLAIKVHGPITSIGLYAHRFLHILKMNTTYILYSSLLPNLYFITLFIIGSQHLANNHWLLLGSSYTNYLEPISVALYGITHFSVYIFFVSFVVTGYFFFLLI